MAASRIAIIVARLGPYHAARLRATARRLGQERIVAIEVARDTREYAWDRVDADGFQLRTLCTDRRYEDLGARELRKLMHEALESEQPDVVAVNGWGFPEARAALDWCGRQRRGVVLMSDSQVRDAPRSWLKETVKRAMIAGVESAFAAGSPHAEYLVALGMRADRIVQGYDVVDNAYFREGAERARSDAAALRRRLDLPARYLLGSARFVPKKNLHRLLQAYALYRGRHGERAWNLVLLGDGPERLPLERRRGELGLETSVQMPGFKQYGELPAYYGLASAFVLPSTTEQWGLVVNEAMAARLPVLVSEACGCAELVNDGINGYRFDPNSIDGMADAIGKVTSDEPRLGAMGDAAATSVARYSPEAFAAGLERAAGMAVAHRRPSRPSLLTQLALRL
jgi:glycosyltransferase involved in cell wall biosynthesis